VGGGHLPDHLLHLQWTDMELARGNFGAVRFAVAATAGDTSSTTNS
jgi:hypothetical protein